MTKMTKVIPTDCAAPPKETRETATDRPLGPAVLGRREFLLAGMSLVSIGSGIARGQGSSTSGPRTALVSGARFNGASAVYASSGVSLSNLTAFSASILFRPRVVNAQQYIFAIGDSANINPIMGMYVGLSGGSTFVVRDVTAAANRTISWAPAGTVHAGRLYHVLVSWRVGYPMECYVRSIAQIYTGVSSVDPGGMDRYIKFSAANRASIGSRHDASTAKRLIGDIYHIHLYPEYIGNVRSKAIYELFCSTNPGADGYIPQRSAYIGGLFTTTPLIDYRDDEIVEMWISGNNRALITFPAVTGSALTCVGLSRGLEYTENPVVGQSPTWVQDYDRDADPSPTALYAIPSGSFRSTPFDDRTKASYVMTGVAMRGLRDEFAVALGESPTMLKFRVSPSSGAGFLAIKKPSTTQGFLFRAPKAADWTNPNNWTLVLRLGCDSANGLAAGTGYTTHQKDTRWLDRNGMLFATFNGSSAIYVAEYNAGTSSASQSTRIWYSVDDGVTWGIFWEANPMTGTTHFRHCHGLAWNPDDSQLLVMMGDNYNEAALLVGTTATTWSAINNTSPANIAAAAGVTWSGKICYGLQKYRWISAIYKDGYFFGHVDGSTDVGIYALKKDCTSIQRVFRSEQQTMVGAAVRGGSALAATADGETLYYMGDFIQSGTGSLKLQVHASRDCWFWQTVAEWITADNRASNIHNCNVFQDSSGRIFLNPNSQANLLNSTKDPVVRVGDERILDQALLDLNIP